MTLKELKQLDFGEGEKIPTITELITIAKERIGLLFDIKVSGLNEKLVEIMGPDFEKLKGRGTEKKFLTWLTKNVETKSPRFKLAIKEEMESSKFGIF